MKMKRFTSTILSLVIALGLMPSMGMAATRPAINRGEVNRGTGDTSSDVKTIKDVTIKDLDAPYHYSKLDKDITVDDSLTVESVKYTLFKKELEAFSVGDEIVITVKVKTKLANVKLDSEGRAYWTEQDAYSVQTNAISDNEVEYVFTYTVQAGDAPAVQTAHFNIDVPKNGEALPTEVTHPLSPGVNVKSVEWTPADETADASKEYTVKIEFDKEDEYVWADGFEDQAVVSVNGKYAPLNRVQKGKFFYYYTEAVIQPEEKAAEATLVAETAHFNIAVPKDGEAFPTEVTHPLSPGIDVKSVEWSPADEKADANKEYTVKITFGTERSYVWADGFEDQAVVSVNGKNTPLKKTYPNRQLGRKFFYYYTEATIQPTAVANNNTSGKTDENDKGNSSSSTPGSSNGGGTSNSGSKPSSSENYVFPFVDVTSAQWYYDSVRLAHKMGLINGQSSTIYAPESNMTFAEAVKLAVCMNILYNGGNPNTDIANGTNLWYSTYMKYALDNGIIDNDLTARANENISRKEYAYIFSKALPEKAFVAKNNIPSGSIPDVRDEISAQDKAIYLLYRAGILAGNDSKGTFNPSANIRRSEVAAILIRMMDTSVRVTAPADLAK